MGRRGYPPEFRRRVLDLVEAGRKIADVAHDLGIIDQTIYSWRRQDRIDLAWSLARRRRSRLSLSRRASGSASWRRRLAVHRRATALLKEKADPKGASRPST